MQIATRYDKTATSLRVMDINQLSTVTAEVVETARESLVVGVL